MGWLHGFSLKLRGNLAFGLAFALAAVGGSLAVRLIVEALLPPGFPFITFFPSVMIVTYLAGLRPGILAAVLSVLAAWYFFIPPADAYGVRGGGAVAFFILVAAIDIAIIHAMRIALDRLDGERRRSAELSRQSQVMFAELQHRVSNNLQLVSTLLMIGQSKVSEPLAVKVLEEARSRVAMLGRLHRMLHDPTRQDVDLGDYLRELCQEVIWSAGAPQVNWEVAADPIRVPADKLIPLALIVAELVCNSLEHAFPEGQPGKISVSVAVRDGSIRLAERDNGPGLPPGFDLDAQTSLGLRIVRSLAAQLRGRLTMANDGGAVATLVFPA